jgi:hypothetical protein
MRFFDAIARGWSVIPVRLDQKPCIKWTRFQKKPAEKPLISKWEKDFKPKAWTVITGKVSGLVILDFDGAKGRETMAKLGLNPHVKIGSGGYHVYLEHPGWKVARVGTMRVFGWLCSCGTTNSAGERQGLSWLSMPGRPQAITPRARQSLTPRVKPGPH